MKNTVKFILITLFSIFAIFRIGKWTGILQNFLITTVSNEPALNIGDRVLGTNLIEPEKFDLILYKTPNNLEQSEIWSHRLCGTSNDTILIKDGTLFINGINVDQNLQLKHSYITYRNKLPLIIEKTNINQSNYFMFNADSIIIQLTKKEAEFFGISNRYIKKGTDEEIRKIYDQNWNEDNFGPLIIPKDFLFVLGDNRNNSLEPI